MCPSLQDQLLKLGMANKKQAQQAKTQKRQKTKQKKGGQADSEAASREAALAKERAEKIAKDRLLNEQREKDKQQRAIEAQIVQLIQAHTIAIPADAEITYNFVQGTLIKRLYVTEELQNQLTKGFVAIAIDGDNYRLVPDAVASRIAERDATRVIRVIQRQEEVEDDPYADYAIPDDLMW